MKMKSVSRRVLFGLLAVSLSLANWGAAFAAPDGVSASARKGRLRADLSRLVVVGDSLSAGFQNGSLIDSGQLNGYANLVAQQAGTPLPLPLIAPPGIPNVLVLVSPGPPPVITRAPGFSPGRLDPFLQPFDLAVPGHTVQDALTTRPGVPVDSLTDLILGLPSTFIFGQPPRSQVEQAEILAPTTTIVWLGSNDALGAALSGDPAFLTPTAEFRAAYGEVLERLAAGGGTLVVANVPDVTAIPALTPAKTLARQLGLRFSQVGPVLGLGAGDYVTPAALELIPGILANPSSGPLPDSVVLTAGEAARINARVSQYNRIISELAERQRAVQVDINGLLERLSKRGYVVDGQLLTTDFLGGVFSLDGIHPTNTGYAIIANEFIEALNRQARTSIPPVDVAAVMHADPLVFPQPVSTTSAAGKEAAASFRATLAIISRR